MAAVPLEDLPDNLVPENDLPSEAIAIINAPETVAEKLAAPNFRPALNDFRTHDRLLRLLLQYAHSLYRHLTLCDWRNRLRFHYHLSAQEPQRSLPR